MQMILCPIASGSAGNATYVSMGETRLLVDAGISAMRLNKSLASIGVESGSLSGILITHEHVDHIRGLPVFCKKYHVPIYANPGTWAGILARDDSIPEELRRIFTTDEDFFIGGINVTPFAIPHDAADPVGYSFASGNGRLAVATDLGYIRDEWVNHLSGCQALVLEANHDVDLVKNGPYPAHLKNRILSRKGHLCNEDCGSVLVRLANEGTQAAFLGHLSEENNLPELAASTVSRILTESGIDVGRSFWLGVARRSTVSDMLRLEV